MCPKGLHLISPAQARITQSNLGRPQYRANPTVGLETGAAARGVGLGERAFEGMRGRACGSGERVGGLLVREGFAAGGCEQGGLVV